MLVIRSLLKNFTVMVSEKRKYNNYVLQETTSCDV